ncbi:AAA family ATPase [Paenibacillus sp. 1001270B_150601_E10]|uniref:AAA family ATPase n=1 Tax=Paenibacillus sp. 1001270B_150601_E10 TaxID=2787079 RepID=UPI00189C8C95|nr:SMC family ATPase [Paenibacillus sp. 1001270B_150601_E10]
MRPLKLKMIAFGPYKDEETIDFTELKENRLFVVSGQTGAGKTSIFDAISFALYGEASGEDRNDSRLLRSHFADDQVHTSVDFEFELKGRAYRVFRQIPHVKAGNKVATGERYELYELVDGKEVPLTDRFIVTQVNDKIRDLIGLTKEQFSQIVMLPQGEFRKLLTSETENKEEILRRLFKTGLYKYVADALNEQRKEKQQACSKLFDIRTYQLHQVRDELGARVGSLLQEVFAQEQYNAYQVMGALVKELEYTDQLLHREQELREQELTKLQQITTAYHEARNLNEQFDQLEQHKAEAARLLAEHPVMEEQTELLAQAEKAVTIQVHEEHVEKQVQELLRKREQWNAAQHEHELANTTLQAADQQYKQEEALQGRRDQALKDHDRLHGYVPLVKELAAKEQQVEKLRREASARLSSQEALTAKLQAHEENRLKFAQNVRELEGSVAGLPAKTERLSLLRQQAQSMKHYLRLQEERTALMAQEEKLRAAYQKLERELVHFEEQWIEGQAGLLASHLHDGEACPVCGSSEHPKKAKLQDELPTKEALDHMRKQKSAAEKAHLELVAELRTNAAQQKEREAELLEYGFELEHCAERFVQLVAEGKQLNEEEAKLKQLAASLAPLKEELAGLERECEELRKQKELASAALLETKEAFAAAKAGYDQAVATVPEELRGLERLEQELRASEQLKAKLEAAWKQAQEEYRKANERMIEASASLRSTETQAKEAEQLLAQAQERYLEALREGGFGTEEAYRSAKLSVSEREQLKARIEQYRTACAAVEKRVEELTQRLQGKERQELSQLFLQLEEQERIVEKQRETSLEAEGRYKKGCKLQAELERIEQEWQQAEHEYAQVKDLYDVVRGENEKKISFERYLQIEFLEQIIHAANQRLHKMSGGQFYLVRSDRMEKRGRQSGLGFDVYDNYTGQFRDVKTLSGGEKFNASLCLALGMADVIQAYEGGISLETMFIDEGFGSLDEESLNKAIDTLIDLQQTGRMIGVISHVQELKAAIPAVLEVKKTKEGYSYTRFHVS